MGNIQHMSKFSAFGLVFILSLYTLYTTLYTRPVEARITPQDIVDQKREDFTRMFNNYTPANQQKIQDIIDAINQDNANNTAVLEAIMLYQGQILDEYLSRNKFIETESIHDARYWLTFAHEAIDYQKQRVYIPILTSQSNINSDLLNLLSSYKSQLNYAQSTAVKSLNKIAATVKGLGSQKVASPSAGGGE